VSFSEEGLLRRFSGRKIIRGSIILALAGVMPLLLYIWLGPRDGNPIGLGLLAMVTLPVAAFGLLVGLVKLLVESLQRRGR
jgi:hypothetical protein